MFTLVTSSHGEYTITQLTNNDYYDGWSPQINNSGYVVWQGCVYFLPIQQGWKDLNRYVYPRGLAGIVGYLLDMWKISCFKTMTNYIDWEKTVGSRRYFR